MKEALQTGDARTLNLYSTSGGGFLGWAYLPEDRHVAEERRARRDRDPLRAPFRAVTIANFNLGHTATHEVGHWLGPRAHVRAGLQRHGDYVDDTPAQKVPTNGCPEGQDTCREAGLDPIHNYMDYSYDTCYWEFTAGQTQRMRDAWLLWRA